MATYRPSLLCRSLDPGHLKLLNTALEDWFKRHSKLLMVMSPPFIRDEDASQQKNARAHQRQWHRSMTLVLVVLEACARRGIRCQTRSAPTTPVCGA